MRSGGSARLVAQAVRTVWAADRAGTVVAGAFQVVGALSGLALVLASKLAIDALTGPRPATGAGLPWALALLAGATAVSAAVGGLQAQQQRLLGEKVAEHMWRDLLRTCLSVDLLSWDSTDFIERLDRIRSNALERPTAVVTALLGLAGSLLGVVALSAAILAIHPLLLPLLFAAGVPSVLISRRAGRAEFGFVRRTGERARQRLYLKQLSTDRAHAAETRAFDAGPHLLRLHDEADRDYLAALRRHVRLRQRLAALSAVGTAVALALTLLLIVWLVRRGDISVAEAGAAAIAARLLGSQLSTSFSSVGSLIESAPFLADMRAFLGASAPESSSPEPRALQDALVLDGVSFSYGRGGGFALHDVSITIPRGQVVAVVGENGSGKSTVAKILSGLYEPTEGKRSWDGDAAISARDLRASVTVLFQDFIRYQMTAADNVSIAQTTAPADAARITEAARAVGIDAAVRSLPDGWQTLMGFELGEGAELSGGQWQRLALARALYRDAPVVVLDEPTAAMDPRAEQALFADVRRILQGRSALLISHRYSSVRLADHIYVMAAGRVVEDGTHEELMALGGTYAELYTLQAAAYLR